MLIWLRYRALYVVAFPLQMAAMMFQKSIHDFVLLLSDVITSVDISVAKLAEAIKQYFLLQSCATTASNTCQKTL